MRRLRARTWILASWAALAAAGCSRSGVDACSTSGSFDLPSISMLCTVGDAALKCHDGSPPTADGKKAWIAILPVTGDCDTFDPTDTYYARAYATTTCSTNGCTAAISSGWTNSNGDAVTRLPGGTYRFCSFIDAYANDQVTFDDPRTASDQPIDSCGRAFQLNGYYDS